MSSIEEFDHRIGKNNRLSKEKSRSRVRCSHSRARSSSSRDVNGSPLSRFPNLRDRRYFNPTRERIVDCLTYVTRRAFGRQSTEINGRSPSSRHADILRSRLLDQGNMNYNHDMEMIPHSPSFRANYTNLVDDRRRNFDRSIYNSVIVRSRPVYIKTGQCSMIFKSPLVQLIRFLFRRIVYPSRPVEGSARLKLLSLLGS